MANDKLEGAIANPCPYRSDVQLALAILVGNYRNDDIMDSPVYPGFQNMVYRDGCAVYRVTVQRLPDEPLPPPPPAPDKEGE